MSIKLSDYLVHQCLSILRLGNLMNIFETRELWNRGIVVTYRLNHNKLFIQDIQDIQRLGEVICESELVQKSTKEDILAINTILTMFIETAAFPTRVCGAWANVND